MGDQPLFEREAELAMIADALSAATAGNGRTLFLQAPAGMGKTTLLGRVITEAEASGALVARARASELEAEFAFGVVRQLFEVPVREAVEDEPAVLDGAAALAAPVLGLSDASAPTGDAEFSVLHGLFWLVSNICVRRAVVLVVDDAHWADGPSLRFVAYLAARLEGIRVLLVIATRPGDQWRHADLLLRLSTAPGTTVLHPGPLSRGSVESLIELSLGTVPSADFAAACHTAVAGNPFYLELLLRDVARRGLNPATAPTSAVMSIGPGTVGAAAQMTLGRLSETARALARAIAVLGDGCTPHEATTFAALDAAVVPAALDALVAAMILSRGDGLAFAHPIVRNAIYESVGERERASLHARAATSLQALGAASERVAAHLLLSDPAADAQTVAEFRSAASAAMMRGAPATAVAYLTRAAQEYQVGEARNELLRQWALAEAAAFLPTALERLEQASQTGGTTDLSLAVARSSAAILATVGAHERATATLEAAAARWSDPTTGPALTLRADILGNRVFGASEVRDRRGAFLREYATADDTTPQGRSMLAALAMESAKLGTGVGQTTDLARRAFGDGTLIAEHDPVSFGPACLLLALSATEDLGFAEGAARAALEANQRRGATGGVAMCSAMLALIVYRKGSVLEAEAYARAAVELTPPMLVVSSLGNHAALLDALVERGHLEEATAALETAGLMGELPQIGIAALLLDRRAQLFLARGDLEAARADLLEAEKLATGWGLLNPAFCSWRARSAALHARLGETDRARSLAAEDLERAEAYGASRAQGIARMTMGLAADDDHERIHWLSRAVGALEHSPASLEHARALAELGAALRRSNRRSDSRAPLQHAIDLARRCGAAPLAERAHDELRATSARPRRLVFTGVDSLTASELRIAKLAAGGRANPEIAQELYVTRKTVETHLTSVYRKLSITSRRELADALAR